MDDRMQIAMTVAAALAKSDDKPCRRKSNVLDGIAYADDLVRWLGEIPSERVHGSDRGAASRAQVIGEGHPISLRDVGA